jgi:endonuclease YncB( thermonuclease family)
MKKLSVFLFSLLIAFTSVCGKPSQVKRYFIGVKVIDFLEHNRLRVKDNKGPLNIKLIGVNLPDKKSVEKKAASLPENERKQVLSALKESSAFLKKAVSPGDVVYMEKGFSDRDRYGNTLVYLYLPNIQMLNLEYVRRGYSLPETDTDNVKYKADFYDAASAAKRAGAGFWPVWNDVSLTKFRSEPPPSVISLPGSAMTEKISSAEKISVMTFNVENLMDTKHDPGKMDYQYMPLADKQSEDHKAVCAQMKRGKKECLEFDWSEKELLKKMQRVSAAILAADGGRGPDLLILQEVENISVLETLTRGHLAGAGYRVIVLIDGDDFRGIDIGMLSRLQLEGKPVLHKIPFNPEKASRDILEARFKLPGGGTLIALGIHFPSQASTVEFRIQAMVFLNSLIKSMPKDSPVIAAGDFNVTSDEVLKYNFFSKYASDLWLVSHDMVQFPYKGTTYYPPQDNWSYFDVILFSKNLGDKAGKTSGWRAVPESIKIENSSKLQYQIKNGNKYPRRFEDGGVSDHWPVSAVIKRK